MPIFQLIIDRALVWTDKIPKLVETGPGDYDSTSYRTWKYWEEHSRFIMCSTSYNKVLEYKQKIENREIAIHDWTNRPYRLHIVCLED